MKRVFRLAEEDLLSKDHFPVKAVLDMIPDSRFIRTLKCISEGHGFGENYGACTFPSDLDDYDIATRGSLDGVEFALHNGEDVVLNYNTFYYYLKKVCDSYVEDFANDREQIDNLLEKIRKSTMRLESSASISL